MLILIPQNKNYAELGNINSLYPSSSKGYRLFLSVIPGSATKPAGSATKPAGSVDNRGGG